MLRETSLRGTIMAAGLAGSVLGASMAGVEPAAGQPALRGRPAPAALLEQAVLKLFSAGRPPTLRIETGTVAQGLLGRFKKLQLQASHTSVNGMAIESAAAMLENFAIDLPRLRDTSQIRLLSAERFQFRIRVPERGLNWLLSTNRKLARDGAPKLELGDGRVTLTGHVRSGPFSSSVSVKGKLVARNEHEVHFLADRMSIGFVRLPRFLTDTLVRRLNPVATLEKLTGPQGVRLRITNLAVTRGFLTVEGRSP